ncbi:MAG: class I SAM-dependent methyltransferase [Actinomycetota bacterium]
MSVASLGALLEVGAYCGKSTIYLGAAARQADSTLFSLDYHRGSEEHQAGDESHDQRVVDSDTGLVDTLPHWRRTVAAAGLEATGVGIVGDSRTVAAHWNTPLALVFVDGSHSPRAATNDYEGGRLGSCAAAGASSTTSFQIRPRADGPPTKSIDALLAPVPKVDQRSSMRASPASPSNTPPSTGQYQSIEKRSLGENLWPGAHGTGEQVQRQFPVRPLVAWRCPQRAASRRGRPRRGRWPA